MAFRTARVLLQSKDAIKWRSPAKDESVFERNLDGVEDFHLHHGAQNVRSGRRRLDLTVSVRLRVDPGVELDVEHACAAWIGTRRKHPAIASTVQGSKRIYSTLDPDQIDAWVNQSFLEIPGEEEISAELLESLPASELPILYFLPDSKIFALRTPQHLIDTIGGTMVLNDFLSELNTTIMGMAVSSEGSLASSLKESASLPSASVSQLARLWNIRRKWLRSFPSVGVVPDFEDEFPQSGQSCWQQLSYSANSTKELVVKARKHKMSVTHVLHAGVAFASKEYGPFTLTRNYNSVILLDMRRRCGNDIKARNAASSQHALWPISIPVTSFWKTAELLQSAYQDVLNDPDFPALVEPVMGETYQTVLPTECSVPTLASVGVIDDHLESSYGSFSVDDFSLSMECAGDEVLVAVWSYQRKLRIRAMYNEGYHSERSIARYLHLLELSLRDGAGVSLAGE